MQAQGVHVLREQLRSQIESNEKMRIDHNSLLKHTQNRQAALEESNAEMVKVLAEQTRIVAANKNTNGSAEREVLAEKDAEVEALQRELARASAMLEEEKSQRTKISQDLRRSELEHKQFLQVFEEEKQHTHTRTIAMEEKLRDALQKIAEGGGGAETASGRGDAWHSPFRGGGLGEEEELRLLTKQLLQKQGMVLELQAERVALTSKVQDLSSRCKHQEQKIISLTGELEGTSMGGGRGGFEDESLSSIESGGIYHESEAEGAMGLLRNRRGRGVGGRKVINDLEKLGVTAGPRVTHAVNVIDNLTLETGNFFRLYPLMRMLFVIYLLLLHFWVLIVLTYSLPST